jgi:hypothetical protein
MGIELIQHNMIDLIPWIFLYQPLDKTSQVLFCASIPTVGIDFTRGEINGGNQRLGAMSVVFKLPGNRLACRHEQILRYPFKRLDACHFIGTKDHLIFRLRDAVVHLTNIGNSFLFALIGFGVQPVTASMRLQVFFLNVAHMAGANGLHNSLLDSLLRQFFVSPMCDGKAMLLRRFTSQGHDLTPLFRGNPIRCA